MIMLSRAYSRDTKENFFFFYALAAERRRSAARVVYPTACACAKLSLLWTILKLSQLSGGPNLIFNDFVCVIVVISELGWIEIYLLDYIYTLKSPSLGLLLFLASPWTPLCLLWLHLVFELQLNTLVK